MLRIITIAASILFLADSAANLTGCMKQNKKIQYITKPLLLPLLLAAAFSYLIQRMPDSRNIIRCMTGALLAGTAGDILLLNISKTKRVVCGAAFFILGHLCWFNLFSPSFKLFPQPAALVCICVIVYAVLFLCFYFFTIGRQPAKETAGLTVYACIIGALHFSTFVTLIGARTVYSAILFAGATSFIASDCILALELFGKPLKHNSFTVMILYICAEMFLTLGSVLMIM